MTRRWRRPGRPTRRWWLAVMAAAAAGGDGGSGAGRPPPEGIVGQAGSRVGATPTRAPSCWPRRAADASASPIEPKCSSRPMPLLVFEVGTLRMMVRITPVSLVPLRSSPAQQKAGSRLTTTPAEGPLAGATAIVEAETAGRFGRFGETAARFGLPPWRVGPWRPHIAAGRRGEASAQGLQGGAGQRASGRTGICPRS